MGQLNFEPPQTTEEAFLCLDTISYASKVLLQHGQWEIYTNFLQPKARALFEGLEGQKTCWDCFSSQKRALDTRLMSVREEIDEGYQTASSHSGRKIYQFPVGDKILFVKQVHQIFQHTSSGEWVAIGQDLVTGDHLAIKCVFDRERFENERKILSRLPNSRYTYSLISSMELDGNFYLAFPLIVPPQVGPNGCEDNVDYMNFFYKLYQTSQDPDALFILQDLFGQVAHAVQFLQSQEVVHLDIKSENILFDQNGDVKICDYGLSRIVEGLHQNVMISGLQGTAGHIFPPMYACTKETVMDLKVDTKIEPESTYNEYGMSQTRVARTFVRTSREVIHFEPYSATEAEMWGMGMLMADLLFFVVQGTFLVKSRTTDRDAVIKEVDRLIKKRNENLRVPDDIVSVIFKLLRGDRHAYAELMCWVDPARRADVLARFSTYRESR